MRTYLIIAVVLCLIGGAVAFMMSSDGTGATEVRMTEVKNGVLVESVSAPGVVEPKSKVDVSAEVSARIMELPAREGARVKKGDVLVRMDGRDLQAALAGAEARRDGDRFRLEAERSRIQGAKQNQENVRAILARTQALHDTGDVSRQQLDDAIARARDIESQVQAAEKTIAQLERSLAASEATIEQSREAVRRTVIVSPIDGLVTYLKAEVGELAVVGIMNSPGTLIMTVADLGAMHLNAKVAETDIARVAVGQDAKIYVNAYKDDPFDGKVSEIALQRTVEKDGTGSFKVLVNLDLKGRQIFSGLTGNVDIDIARQEGLIVPSQAVVERPVNDLPESVQSSPLVQKNRRVTTVVFRVVDGKAVVTPVLTGPSNLTDTLIKEGLTAGDTIITGPYRSLEKLKDGEAVEKEDPSKDASRWAAAEEARGQGGGMGPPMGGGRRGMR
ncbi:MAG: efflux RND transporter periplasmic adaptor subunit [Planctomycetes bacterium]|nr:efflux RND transporter periplasmic adaptor subunit [Planctomycetota bacterium]